LDSLQSLLAVGSVLESVLGAALGHIALA
jgi:hypothetical protein